MTGTEMIFGFGGRTQCLSTTAILRLDLAGSDLTEYLMKTTQARELCHYHRREGHRSGCERESSLHCLRLRHRAQFDCEIQHEVRR